MTLIDKLSALTGPDREVDALIFRLLANAPAERHWYEYNGDFLSDDTVPRVTASIDAAMTLVPEGDEFEIANLYGVARVTLGMNRNDDGPYYGEDPCGSIAIALCIAALQARGI